ncbi:unnamed protein product [Brassica oleracea var. botrytis]|uniref:(rape) hypothetical protein n=1 Tax=Brassica napus TaxID=3708 RepID=A0A816RJ04_BRANA|nr:unnamed protein product [Brassica napus]
MAFDLYCACASGYINLEKIDAFLKMIRTELLAGCCSQPIMKATSIKSRKCKLKHCLGFGS